MENKLRTPTAKGSKEEKSPLSFKSKEQLQKERIDSHCLTPKERLTPKGKSGFKLQKA